MKFQFLPIYEPSIVTKYDHKGALLNQTCDRSIYTDKNINTQFSINLVFNYSLTQLQLLECGR